MNSISLLSTGGLRLLRVLNKAKCLSFYTFNGSTALQKVLHVAVSLKLLFPLLPFLSGMEKSSVFTPVLPLSTGELRLFKRDKKL